MTEIRYRVRQRGERWGKNKISSFIIFIGRQSILRYIILDGRSRVLQEILDEIRIPGASTLAFEFTGHTSRGDDIFNTVTRDDRLPNRGEVFDGNSNRWHTTRTIGKWPNCSRTVRMCPLIRFARVSCSLHEQCFPKRTCEDLTRHASE